MSDGVTFSIIIPFKTWNSDLEECLSHIQGLASRFFEVILLPDEPVALPAVFREMQIEVIATGEVNPAVKRDIGADKAQGNFLAFIDDDAYPQSDWLDVALETFDQRPDVAAIGGPGITPKTDPFWARVSGAVFLSPTSGGFPERYVSAPPARTVSDWPSVNMIVRKKVFDRVGGFDSNYWPGEDTLFCLKIIENANEKILYVPNLIVWHHRRPGLQKHLRQVGNYGLHRGFFAKRHPGTSLRLKYFIPTLWSTFVFIGLGLSLVYPWVAKLYVVGWLVYLSALVLSGKDILRYEPMRVALGAAPYIFLTHLWYGVKFVQGVFAQELHSSLGR